MSSSLTLEELAVRFGVPVPEIRAALREGDFPGRYLVDGTVRVPLEEVDRAEPSWRARHVATIEPELHSDLRPASGVAWSSEAAEGLRDLLLCTLRNEREALVDLILTPLERQEQRFSSLEAEIRSLRTEVRALGPGSSEIAGDEAWETDDEPVGEATGTESAVDLRGLIREIADLESLLTDFDAD